MKSRKDSSFVILNPPKFCQRISIKKVEIEKKYNFVF